MEPAQAVAVGQGRAGLDRDEGARQGAGRRYESAIGLARDLERCLNHEPVAAGPPSASLPAEEVRAANRGQVIAARSDVALGSGRLCGPASAEPADPWRAPVEARPTRRQKRKRRCPSGEKLAGIAVQVEAEKKKTEEEKKVAVAVKDFLQNEAAGPGRRETQADCPSRPGGSRRRRRRPTRTIR